MPQQTRIRTVRARRCHLTNGLGGCQNCSSPKALHVHHLAKRSSLGNDALPGHNLCDLPSKTAPISDFCSQRFLLTAVVPNLRFLIPSDRPPPNHWSDASIRSTDHGTTTAVRTSGSPSGESSTTASTKERETPSSTLSQICTAD